ncbi:hypothetical protein [Streptomyces sp. ODS28]|uniref:hypothetical protein n=1 Tax=Streptomyces sp. ODS28 TaxID=3136688 RepID=UPI0031EE91B3
MNRSTTARALAAGLLSLSLVGAAAAPALADDRPPRQNTGHDHHPADHRPGPRPSAAGQQGAHEKTNTARVHRTDVRAWQDFRISGATHNVKPDSRVVVQHKHHGKWETLPISARLPHSGKYGVRVRLGAKGKHELRTVVGGVPSKPFFVKVR